MSDIFISYASADRERARLFAEFFAARGWSVWWDRVIPAGQDFDEVIEEALDAARCVVVLWSTTSVASRWVKTESAEAMRRKALIPVLIEEARIPLEFRRLQTVNLSLWQGELDHPELPNFVQSLEAHLHGARNSAPPASGPDRSADASTASAAPGAAFRSSAASKPFPLPSRRNGLRNALIAGGMLVAMIVGWAGYQGTHPQSGSVGEQRTAEVLARRAADTRDEAFAKLESARAAAARETAQRASELASAAVVRNSVSRNQADASAATAQTKDAQPAVPFIGGTWRDDTGAVHQIRQSGTQYEIFTANPANGYTARGTGAINGRQLVTEFQTNLPSTGRASGTLAADGQSMRGTVSDSRLGQYALTLRR